MAKALSGSPSTLKLAYVESGEHTANPFVDMAGVVSRRCGSRAVSHSPSFDLALDVEQGKHVVSISLPPLEDGETGSSRKSAMANHGECSCNRGELCPLDSPLHWHP